MVGKDKKDKNNYYFCSNQPCAEKVYFNFESFVNSINRKTKAKYKIKIINNELLNIKEELNFGILILRLKKIIENYAINDEFIQYIKQYYSRAIQSNEKIVFFSIRDLSKFITNFLNIFYHHETTSKEILYRLQMLLGRKIHYIKYYGHTAEVKLVKNEMHSELIGTFIGSGTVRFDDKQYFRIGVNRALSNVPYINRLKDLLTEVFNKEPELIVGVNSDYLNLSGKSVVQYFKSQGLSNKNRRVPSWIKRPSQWILKNPYRWKVKYLPLVIACLKGIINASGSIHVNARKDKVLIRITKRDKYILEDFKTLCESLNITTSNLSKGHKHKDGHMSYSIAINTVEDVKRFLLDVVKPIKWEIVKDKIITDLKIPIDEALGITHELSDLKRYFFEHQNMKYIFRYHPARIEGIENLILRNSIYNYIENISFRLFPYNEFQRISNIRPSSLKFQGDLNERITVDFIEKSLINDLISNNIITIYNKSSGRIFRELLDLVSQLSTAFRKKYIGIDPHHEFLLKNILLKHSNAIATEVPVWKKLDNNEYIIGHIDLILVNGNTLIVAEYKTNKTEMIKALPQIMSYGLMFKRLIFPIVTNLNIFKIKCLIFTEDIIWEFDPDSLKSKIINFIKHVNSVRKNPLKSLPFAQGLQRTNLLKDIEKVIAFLQVFT